MVFYSFVFYYMFIVFYYLYMLLCVHDVYLNIYLMYIHIVGIVLYYITCKLATRCIQIICTWHAYIFTFRLLLLLGRRGAQGVDQGGKPGRCLQAEKGRAGPNPSPLCFGEAVCLHHAKVRLPRELQIHHSNMKSVCQGARQSACTPVPYPYNALVAHCGRRFHVFSHLVLTQ